jgi:hypothetical protein
LEHFKLFSGRNIFDFAFQDVAMEFPEKNPVHPAGILSEMVEKGMLCKIKRDSYHIIPYHVDPAATDQGS